MQAMFDRVAERYDLMNRLMTFGMDRSWRRRTLDALGLPPSTIVLDLACGTGDFCRELARRDSRGVGLDVAFGMLAHARAAGSPLVQGDGAMLPFADGVLDGVVSGFALRNFADLAGTLAECARVLHPMGRLALLEVDEPSNRLVALGHGLWFRHAVPLLGALVSVADAYAYLPRSVAYLPPPEELAALLASAGFTDVRRRRLLFGSVQILTATRAGRFGIAA